MALTEKECGQILVFLQRTPLEGKEATVHAILQQRLQEEAKEAITSKNENSDEEQ